MNGQHASNLPIEQRELKGVCSFEENLNVFKREEYYTRLFFFFFFFPEWKKRIQGIVRGGRKCPLNNHLSLVKQFCQSGVGCRPLVYLWQ